MGTWDDPDFERERGATSRVEMTLEVLSYGMIMKGKICHCWGGGLLKLGEGRGKERERECLGKEERRK